MNPSLLDRIISVLSYLTFGIFSIIWIVFANVTKKSISRFLNFNLYQAIFISIILAVISLIYSIAINLLSIIPVINKIAHSFEIFFNQTPLYFGFTMSGFILSLFLFYLSILSLLGRKPYVPMASDIIVQSFGG